MGFIMKRMTFLYLVVVLGFVSAFAVEKSKPNIVLIISDDAGYADFGFNGGEQIPTPHLDKLAKEGGIRIPFTVKLPGTIKPGTKYDKPVSTLDLLPTFLSVAGGKHQGKELDGVDLMPYLTDKKQGGPHE